SWTGRSIRPHLHHLAQAGSCHPTVARLRRSDPRLLRHGPFPRAAAGGSGGGTEVVGLSTQGGSGFPMPLRQRNLVTAALAYFMAWCIVASPAVPILIFSPAGLALVVLIG